MAKYIFGYHGQAVSAESVAQDKAMMAAWGKWFRDMGPALVEIGNPAGPSKVLTADGTIAGPQGVGLTGYSIVEADTIDGAMQLANGCPIFAAGGSIEIAELMPM
jgi:hypothetical protein